MTTFKPYADGLTLRSVFSATIGCFALYPNLRLSLPLLPAYTQWSLHLHPIDTAYSTCFSRTSPLPQGPHFWDECPHPPKGACTAPPNGDFDGYINLFEKGASVIRTNPLVSIMTDKDNPPPDRSGPDGPD